MTATLGTCPLVRQRRSRADISGRSAVPFQNRSLPSLRSSRICFGVMFRTSSLRSSAKHWASCIVSAMPRSDTAEPERERARLRLRESVGPSLSYVYSMSAVEGRALPWRSMAFAWGFSMTLCAWPCCLRPFATWASSSGRMSRDAHKYRTRPMFMKRRPTTTAITIIVESAFAKPDASCATVAVGSPSDFRAAKGAWMEKGSDVAANVSRFVSLDTSNAAVLPWLASMSRWMRASHVGAMEFTTCGRGWPGVQEM
mmetsp:Transcript_9744/g.28581  ORF Transcript_9744/g.28581 Transcript_9744/m.28581 type:complete len:256 (+) Transcript_9744:165-932(+)